MICSDGTKIILESCLAIGECGLDKRIEISLALQQSVLNANYF
jgi:Tat protein secretion system quality control protein TatD with DNase activity